MTIPGLDIYYVLYIYIYIFTYAQFVTYMYMYRGISESNGQSVDCSVVFIGPCYWSRFNLQSFC